MREDSLRLQCRATQDDAAAVAAPASMLKAARLHGRNPANPSLCDLRSTDWMSLASAPSPRHAQEISQSGIARLWVR